MLTFWREELGWQRGGLIQNEPLELLPRKYRCLEQLVLGRDAAVSLDNPLKKTFRRLNDAKLNVPRVLHADGAVRSLLPSPQRHAERVRADDTDRRFLDARFPFPGMIVRHQTEGDHVAREHLLHNRIGHEEFL